MLFKYPFNTNYINIQIIDDNGVKIGYMDDYYLHQNEIKSFLLLFKEMIQTLITQKVQYFSHDVSETDWEYLQKNTGWILVENSLQTIILIDGSKINTVRIMSPIEDAISNFFDGVI
jgi:hypothetical protein